MRRPKTFDLEAEAQRLYRAAEARGDFIGAASVLRLIKDVARVSPPAEPSEIDFDSWTEEEQEELSALTEQFQALKAKAALRQAGGEKKLVQDAPRPTISEDVAPTPLPESPPVEPPDPDEFIEVLGSHGPRLVRRGDLEKAWAV